MFYLLRIKWWCSIAMFFYQRVWLMFIVCQSLISSLAKVSHIDHRLNSYLFYSNPQFSSRTEIIRSWLSPFNPPTPADSRGSALIRGDSASSKLREAYWRSSKEKNRSKQEVQKQQRLAEAAEGRRPRPCFRCMVLRWFGTASHLFGGLKAAIWS